MYGLAAERDNSQPICSGSGTLLRVVFHVTAMADVEAELRQQFTDAFSGADFPIDSQMDLVPTLPDGPGTKFEAGDVTLTAMEMAAKLGSHQDFPYDDVESLVDDVIEGLKAEGMI